MTFEQILAIVRYLDGADLLTIAADKTIYHLAADLYSRLGDTTKPTWHKPNPTNVTAKARKPRGPNKPKPQQPNAELTLTQGGEAHGG